jgi:hypothetical protein
MRYRAGVDTMLDALDTDRDLFAAELALVQNQTERASKPGSALQSLGWRLAAVASRTVLLGIAWLCRRGLYARVQAQTKNLLKELERGRKARAYKSSDSHRRFSPSTSIFT